MNLKCIKSQAGKGYFCLQKLLKNSFRQIVCYFTGTGLCLLSTTNCLLCVFLCFSSLVPPSGRNPCSRWGSRVQNMPCAQTVIYSVGVWKGYLTSNYDLISQPSLSLCPGPLMTRKGNIKPLKEHQTYQVEIMLCLKGP